MPPLTWWQRFLMRLVPTWRREIEAQDERIAHTEAIRLRAIRARISSEKVRTDYRRVATRFR